MAYIPKVGDIFTIKDFESLIEKINDRKKLFPDEPFETSLGVIFFNLGNQYAPVNCINGEWSGLKQDIPKRADGGIPLCPNGHVLFEGKGLRLGWVNDY